MKSRTSESLEAFYVSRTLVKAIKAWVTYLRLQLKLKKEKKKEGKEEKKIIYLFNFNELVYVHIVLTSHLLNFSRVKWVLHLFFWTFIFSTGYVQKYFI